MRSLPLLDLRLLHHPNRYAAPASPTRTAPNTNKPMASRCSSPPPATGCQSFGYEETEPHFEEWPLRLPYPPPMTTPLSTRSFGDFLDQLASKTPTPGGGAVASAVGALGTALGDMVLAYSFGKKKLAEHEPKLHEASAKLSRARMMLLELAAEDEAAYGLVNELSKLPRDDPRRADLPAATLAAARVPLACMAACASVLRLLDTLPGITNTHIHSDLAIAAILAEAAARSAGWNVRVNLPGIADAQERESLTRECEQLLTASTELAGRVERACRG